MMLSAFFVVCGVMVVGMVGWRLWVGGHAESMARLGSADSRTTASIGAPEPAAGPAPGTGAITTEIRVLEANYIVAPGDTLATLARRHDTSVEALASINNIENRNSLSVGQRLIIP